MGIRLMKSPFDNRTGYDHKKQKLDEGFRPSSYCHLSMARSREIGMSQPVSAIQLAVFVEEPR
jgi:hypothetical protein